MLKSVAILVILFGIGVVGGLKYYYQTPIDLYELDNVMPYRYRFAEEYYRIRFNPVEGVKINANLNPKPKNKTSPKSSSPSRHHKKRRTTTPVPATPIIYEVTKKDFLDTLMANRIFVFSRYMSDYAQENYRFLTFYELPPINVTKLPSQYVKYIPFQDRINATLEDLQTHPELYMFVSMEELEDLFIAYALADETDLDNIEPIIRVPFSFDLENRTFDDFVYFNRYDKKSRSYLSRHPRFNLKQIKQLIQFWVLNITATPYVSSLQPIKPAEDGYPVKYWWMSHLDDITTPKNLPLYNEIPARYQLHNNNIDELLKVLGRGRWTGSNRFDREDTSSNTK